MKRIVRFALLAFVFGVSWGNAASSAEVQKFGAVGDGVSDDTTALESALSYAARNNDELRLEQGKTYRITGPLTLKNCNNVLINGNGSTIKMADEVPAESGNYIIMFEACRNFQVIDLIVDGNRQQRNPVEVWAHNVIVKGGSSFSFVNVLSKNAVTDGFYLYAVDSKRAETYPQNGLFLRVTADNNFRQGMSIVNGNDIRIIDSIFSRSNGTPPEAGIDLEPNKGSASPAIDRVFVYGSKFLDNMGFGFHQAADHGAITNVTIVKNIFSKNGSGAVRMGASRSVVGENEIFAGTRSTRGVIDIPADKSRPSNNVIVGNYVENGGSDAPAIYVHKLTGPNHLIMNNVVVGFGKEAIIIHRRDVYVDNNGVQ